MLKFNIVFKSDLFSDIEKGLSLLCGMDSGQPLANVSSVYVIQYPLNIAPECIQYPLAKEC
jgi:hypothetical protein